MKIDILINEIKNTTEGLIIITNKNTIDSFFKDINDKHNTTCGVYVKHKDDKKIKSIYRNGVTVHFVNEKDIDKLFL
jgi:hypothetical protein